MLTTRPQEGGALLSIFTLLMFHFRIFSFYFGSNYWKPYWAYVNARLAYYVAFTVDERGFLEFPDP